MVLVQIAAAAIMWPVLNTMITARGFITLAGYFITTLLLFNDRFLKKLAALGMLLILELIAEAIVMPIAFGVVDIQQKSYLAVTHTPDGYGILLRSLYICVLLLLTLAMVGIWKRNVSSVKEKRDWFILAFIAMQIFVTVIYVAYFVSKGMTMLDFQVNENLFSIIVMVIMNLSGIVLIVLFTGFFRKSIEKEAKTAMLEQQFDAQQKYFEELSIHFEDIRKMRHDIKNNLSIINSLLEKNEIAELKKYMRQFGERIKLDSKMRYSDSLAINSIIAYKAKTAQEKGIDVRCDAIMPSSNIHEFDLCSILSNLLDNAIEANDIIEGDKFITLNFVSKSNMFIIYSSNSCSKDATLKSHKVGENHGLGLDIIKKTISKYDGNMEIKIGEGVFEVSIALIP